MAHLVPGSMFYTEDRLNKFRSDEGNYLCLMHTSLVHLYKEDRCVVAVGVVRHITVLVDASLLSIGVDETWVGSFGMGDPTVESCRY